MKSHDKETEMRGNRTELIVTIPLGGSKTLRYGAFLVASSLFFMVAAGCARQADTALSAGTQKNGKAGAKTPSMTIPPLPEAYRAIVMEADPEWLTWSDRLREVFAALPAKAQAEMLATNEYSFGLADLPAEQAAVIRNLLEEHAPTRQWVEHHTDAAAPQDYAGLKFIFGRLNEAEESVRFIIESSQGDRMQPAIGGWPGTPAKPEGDVKDNR